VEPSRRCTVEFDPKDTNGIVSEEDTVVLADVGLGQVIWTTLFLFMLAAFVLVFILAVRHLFRDRELSGWAKAGWLVGLIVFPLFGSLVYLLVRGGWVPEVSAADSAGAGAAHSDRVRARWQQRRRFDGGPVQWTT
jgi:Phospholipase_D-nuclease N-terminal